MRAVGALLAAASCLPASRAPTCPTTCCMLRLPRATVTHRLAQQRSSRCVRTSDVAAACRCSQQSHRSVA
uniref:Bifunctional inhibitor/plant lipid transfer protein/seed storage helical domain-containing protein n=1 Tax=Oryza glaberrima TaxID=4538 RepID=I1NPC2_ORYGL